MSTKLENTPIPTKLRLAILWCVILFFYLYNDVFMLLEHVRSGRGGAETPPDERTMLIYALMIAPAALMPLMNLVMAPTLSRWVNIIVAAAYFAIIVWTLTPADTSWFYLFIGMVENIVTLVVIWTAWRWRREGAG